MLLANEEVRSNLGSVNSDGEQEATLVVGQSLTETDKTYKCRVQSSAYPQSTAAEVTAPLDVYG